MARCVDGFDAWELKVPFGAACTDVREGGYETARSRLRETSAFILGNSLICEEELTYVYMNVDRMPSYSLVFIQDFGDLFDGLVVPGVG